MSVRCDRTYGVSRSCRIGIMKQLASIVLVRGIVAALLCCTSLAAQRVSLVADIEAGGRSSFADPGCVLGKRLFVWAQTRATGNEPWVSDGTSRGTKLLRDLIPGTASSDPRGFVRLGDSVLFVAGHPTLGRVLWISDGTGPGTRMLQGPRFFPAPGIFDELSEPIGGFVYFASRDAGGYELWKSDGTNAGTQRVADINVGAASSYPQRVTRLPQTERLMFFANDGTHGYEPWVSDGTAQGTRLVADLTPGGASTLGDSFAAAGRRLLFQGNSPAHGFELWSTDGSAQGTRLVKDLRSGRDSSNPAYLTRFGKRVIFRAWTNSVGIEPWISDGTGSGTSLLLDILPGVAHSLPRWFEEVSARRLLFAAPTPNGKGTELWTTDGSGAGTRMLVDIEPGAGSSNPSRFVALDDRVYLSAFRAATGRELYALDLSGEARSWDAGEGCGRAARTPTLLSDDPVLGRTMRLTSEGLDANSVGALVLGPPSALRPAATRCTLYTWPIVGIVDVWAQTSLAARITKLPIPNRSELIGVRLAFQTWNLSTQHARGFALSNGAIILVGR